MERRTVLRGLAGVPLGAMAVVSAAGRAGAADYNVVVDPAPGWGAATWEGWGTSLGWWANQLGPREDLADLFFTRKTVAFRGEQVPGLGMNIVRYCAGASGTNVVEGRRMVRQNEQLDGFKQIEGFQRDWYSADPYSASFDWTADANQRAVLQLAKARGADTFELFANSPQWWMLKNDDPTGAADGSCNLQDGNFGRHAAYLATVARYAHDHWGIDFASVQPMNEPGMGWGAPGVSRGQEGCSYSQEQQAELIRLTRAQLDARDLSGTIVTGLDEYAYSWAANTWTSPAFDAATRAAVGRVSVHGYEFYEDRDALYRVVAADGKKIWQSEYGDDDPGGLVLARNLNWDIRWLRASAWLVWQILDWHTYGPITLTGGVLGAVNPKYYVLAQYMRHIRPGMRIVDSGHPDAVAAYDDANHKLVVVAVNHGPGQWINFDLSRFGQPGRDGALVRRWVTGTLPESGEHYRQYEDTYLHGSRFWTECGADTVQTFEIEDVHL